MSRPQAATQAWGHLMLAFEGTELPSWMARTLREHPPAGFTLSRLYNLGSATEMAELTASIERENASDLPLLIAADQETGQLQGLGASLTWFPGNMAIGATRDVDLAYRVAVAVGRELRAVGVTVNYAPVSDLATNTDNPVLGIRSFGDDSTVVSELSSATIRGLQDVGVIATAKHFPGTGEAAVDPHFELPIVDVDLDRLHRVELAPFKAAIKTSVGMIMTSHHSLPSVTNNRDLPATLSADVIEQLLRAELGFDGVVITDALDMGAIAQGTGQIVDVIAALNAGVDLLLCSRHENEQGTIGMAVELATSRGLLNGDRLAASRRRIDRLRKSLGEQPRPAFDIIRSVAHRDLAVEVARRSITLIRNRTGLLPLRVEPGARILAVMPEPRSLTPADSSSDVTAGLATALRRKHPTVTEVTTSNPPTANEAQAVIDQARQHDLVIVGTICAGSEQGQLVANIIQTGTPTVTAALRTPFDLAHYPQADTHLTTYSVVPESLEALADAVFGDQPLTGALPVEIPGLYSTGHFDGR